MTLLTVQKPLLEGLRQEQDYAAPLYQLLVRLVAVNNYHPEWVLRAPAVICAILCIPASWWLVSGLFSQRIARSMLPALILNPIFFRYAREARPYSLFLLLSVLAIGNCLFWLREKRERNYLCCLLSMTLLVYSHYYGFLYVAVLGPTLVVSVAFSSASGNRRRKVYLLGICGLLQLPAVWKFWSLVSTGAPATLGGWLHMPTLIDFALFSPIGELFGVPGLGPALTFCVSATIIKFFRRTTTCGSGLWQFDYSTRCAILGLTTWIIVGVFVPAWMIAVVWRPVYNVRYGIPVLIPLLILALVALDGCPKKLRYIGFGLMLTAMMPEYINATANRTGFPNAVQWIKANTAPDTPVFVTDWPYCDGFQNPEIAGLKYYGLENRTFNRVKLNYPLGKGVAEPDFFPRDEHFILVAFIGVDDIVAHLKSVDARYKVEWMDTLTLFDVDMRHP